MAVMCGDNGGMKLHDDDRVSAEVKAKRVHITNKRHGLTVDVPLAWLGAWLLRMWAKAARDRKE